MNDLLQDQIFNCFRFLSAEEIMKGADKHTDGTIDYEAAYQIRLELASCESAFWDNTNKENTPV